jgi:hypothetical protein
LFKEPLHSEQFTGGVFPAQGDRVVSDGLQGGFIDDLGDFDGGLRGGRGWGWVIGSGMVESGGKRFKDRFTKSGMRWSRPGAERLLTVRAAIMSGRFDERWRAAYNSPTN